MFPTHKGTPQGGTISPLLMNMVLNSMESAIIKWFPRWHAKKVNFVRYADDFVITAKSKEIIEEEIKPFVIEFLKERGLTLSAEKSKIPIVYHVKVKSKANPYLSEYDKYFYQRTKWREDLAKKM